jgi:hypothetical protein
LHIIFVNRVKCEAAGKVCLILRDAAIAQSGKRANFSSHTELASIDFQKIL